MPKLTFDQVREVLPDLDELRPMVDRALAGSEPDGARAWAGSGRLETVGSWIVDAHGLAEDAAAVASEEARHLESVYRLVSEALTRISDGDPTGAAEALLEAGALEEGRDRPERAARYAEAARRVAMSSPAPEIRARAVRRVARSDRTAGRFAQAREGYEESFSIATAVSDPRGAAEAAIGAGNVLEDQRRWDEAERWYRRALEALDSVPQPVPERWHALLNLHIVARSVGRMQESIDLLRSAEREVEALGDASAVAFLENAWGQLRMAEGDHQRADEHLRNALAATRSARALVPIRLNLAESLLARGRTLDAAQQARLAESDAIRARLVPRLPEVYRILGRIAAAEGEESGFVLFERSLAIIRERGLPPSEEALTLSAYADAEEARGEGERASELRSAAALRLEATDALRASPPDSTAPERPAESTSTFEIDHEN